MFRFRLRNIRNISPPAGIRCNVVMRSPVQRRLLSSGEDAAAIRKARLQARKSANPKPAESGKSGGDAVANNESSTMSSAFMGFVASMLAIFGIGVYVKHEVEFNPKGSVAKSYEGSVFDRMFSSLGDVFEPSSDKLIPDYIAGPFYGPHVPKGAPPLPLLVIDLEKTLLSSVHDAKYGWRHVKRPGVDKLLKTASTMFEIAIFSENMMDDEILSGMGFVQDGAMMYHMLGPDAGELRNNIVLKRLDLMNRPLNKIILIDDSPIASSLFPENTLLIKPFTDIYDKNDRELEDLLQLLTALITNNVESFPNTLKNLGSNELSEAIIEYRMRLSEAKHNELRKRAKGLGGLLRSEDDLRAMGSGSSSSNSNDDDIYGIGESMVSKVMASDSNSTEFSGKTIPNITGYGKSKSRLDFVGSGAGKITGNGIAKTEKGDKEIFKGHKESAKKRTGRLFQYIKDSDKAADEAKQEKINYMNEKYAQKQMEKQEEMERKAKRDSILNEVSQ